MREVHKPAQAVIVNVDHGSTDPGALIELEDQVEDALECSDVVEYGGLEIKGDGSVGLT